MDTLPISTLPAPSATTGPECAADAGASTPTEGGFQARAVPQSGGRRARRHGRGVDAAGQDAAGEEGAATTDDAALAALAEAVPGASDSALALLAALPQQAARAEALTPGASASAGTGNALSGEITNLVDDRVGGRSATIAGQRADDLLNQGKGMPLRYGDTGKIPGMDSEKIGEAARGSGAIADLGTAGTQHNVHAAYLHTSLTAPDTMASAPAPAAQPRIDTPLGAPGWSTALADQLIVLAGDKQQVAELRINPPHLGPVDITLTLSDDKASAVFASPHAVVRETIESALPRLREVLAESGIDLGQASVTADSPRDDPARGQARSGFSADRARAGTDAAQSMAAARPGAGRRLPGLVDLFA